MIVPLTAWLIAAPDVAWPRRTAACESREARRARVAHASAVAGVSIGSAALGALVAPRLVPAGVELADLVPRLSATACLPIAASGMFNFAPLWGVTVVWMLAGLALTARSGWIGAAATLGLEGEARRRAAAVVTAASGAPWPLATLLRMLA